METAILRAKKVDPSDRIGKETACRPCSTMHRKKLAYRAVKRLFDITIAAMGLLVLGIPMALVALLIRLDSRGPAIFKQERMGEG